MRQGLATNDLFDVARRSEQPLVDEAQPVATGVRGRRGLSTMLKPARVRPRLGSRPEGRWALIPWQRPDLETQAFFAARLLLQRYGLACRELALLDDRLPPWRVLYEVLNRLELAGEVRRGYFVEGLSGAQFALPEAARQLQDLGLPAHGQAPMILVHSLDPANLYGTGAPFHKGVRRSVSRRFSPAPFEIGEEFTRPLLRRAGNWLVLRAGKPMLVVEQQGKRLTTLPYATRDDLAAAVTCLPTLAQNHPQRDLRRKVTVEEWNGQPVTATDGKDLLAAAGFVNDYQAMTLYAAWR